MIERSPNDIVQAHNTNALTAFYLFALLIDAERLALSRRSVHAVVFLEDAVAARLSSTADFLRAWILVGGGLEWCMDEWHGSGWASFQRVAHLVAVLESAHPRLAGRSRRTVLCGRQGTTRDEFLSVVRMSPSERQEQWRQLVAALR